MEAFGKGLTTIDSGLFKGRSAPKSFFKTNNAMNFILQVYVTYNQRMRKMHKFA